METNIMDHKEKKHDYYARNREDKRAYGRQRYQRKKKSLQKASRRYRAAHANKVQVYNHKYYMDTTKPKRHALKEQDNHLTLEEDL